MAKYGGEQSTPDFHSVLFLMICCMKQSNPDFIIDIITDFFLDSI